MTLLRRSIYLASPLFSPMERRRNLELRDMIAHVAEVYLPQEDGNLLFDLVASGVCAGEAKQRIYDNDVAAIRKCDALVISMDGRCIDEGACFELGYARALDKICLGLKTDARTLMAVGDNPMVEGALDYCFSRDIDLMCWLRSFSLTNANWSVG